MEKVRPATPVCSHSSLCSLKQPRQLAPGQAVPTQLSKRRAWLNSAGLLRFDFLYGDFIRFLGGEYTNRLRDFNAEWDLIEQHLATREVPDDFPPVKKELAYRILTEGVPLLCDYETPMTAMILRERYDNHPAVAANMETVEKKIAKEEWNTYHIHFLRFVYEFIPGLVINPIQWEWDKGKGRICIDCTNGPDEMGSINTYIPKLSLDNELECPEVHYQHAFKRFLQHILRMRITQPTKPIMVHADDIEAAFCRVLYHPDMAVAFAYVFGDYLLVPVGQVFGSRSVPSYYCVLADLRQALAACHPATPPLHSLVEHCQFTVQHDTPLVTVLMDSHHPPLSAKEQELWYDASFVDDNGVVAYKSSMAKAIHASIMSAFEVFGQEGTDRCGACLQAAKWTVEVTESFMFLGFLINTRDMTVSWPYYKRKALYEELQEILDRKRKWLSPKEMAHVVGVVRSASEVAPWGVFLSFNLQNALVAAARHRHNPDRKWWNVGKIFLKPVAIATIQQLQETLLVPEGDQLWSRPIALYLERDFTHHVYSNASYAGIGGWSADFGFLWRLC